MKKIRTILLALILTLCLSACSESALSTPKEFVFPENTQVAGIDISGETRDSAWSKVEAAAASY